uniref:Probable splicing factor YJU2B n=1 Tax=Ursus maritimus TaxID=29073 RepID=A0A452TDD2_URSMA
MSGERKGVNKYYPPDFNPEKHGSLNRYHNSHPLRERARKLSQGILIIRFEMPYNIWCDGCKNHIGMGEQTRVRGHRGSSETAGR